jgi:GDPmannose 4,6-dehydratase
MKLTKSALITGATGQDGHYLTALLCRLGYTVHAQSRSASQKNINDVNVCWHVGDLTDEVFLEALIVSAEPDEVYNLAAVSRPTISWTIPRETAEINAFVPQSICELLRRHRPLCRFFQASSSDMFGDAYTERQNEHTPCEPKSPYGVAKLYAHRIVGAYRQQYDLHACSGIMFNHESAYRPLSFVSQKIAYAAAAVACGLRESSELDERGAPILSNGKLCLGDLSVRRDFGFAGDYAEAMHMILQHPTADDYVIGTGKNHSIREFCEVAFRSVGLDWADYVTIDPDLIRKTDSRYTRADTAKLQSVINWHPKVSFSELVSYMVRAQISLLQGDIASDAVKRAF